jgi:hypothetical protein
LFKPAPLKAQLLAFVVEGTVQFYPPSFSAVNKTVSIEPLPCDLSIRVTNAQQRMRSGALNLAIEIPPGFGRDAECGRPVQISAWIDGAMPTRGEMIRAYGGDASAVAFAEKGSFA